MYSLSLIFLIVNKTYEPGDSVAQFSSKIPWLSFLLTEINIWKLMVYDLEISDSHLMGIYNHNINTLFDLLALTQSAYWCNILHPKSCWERTRAGWCRGREPATRQTCHTCSMEWTQLNEATAPADPALLWIISEGVTFNSKHQVCRYQAYTFCYWHSDFLQISMKIMY